MTRNAFKPVKSLLLRWLLLSIGLLSVALGIAGIFLPVLPTTPFLLLAAACFIRSSQKFYDWLLNHPRLGAYIGYYLDGKGIPRRARTYTLCLLWGSILLSAAFMKSWPLAILLITIALAVSTYLLRMNTLEEPTTTHQSLPTGTPDATQGKSSQGILD